MAKTIKVIGAQIQLHTVMVDSENGDIQPINVQPVMVEGSANWELFNPLELNAQIANHYSIDASEPSK